jgi:hypothetical protein
MQTVVEEVCSALHDVVVIWTRELVVRVRTELRQRRSALNTVLTTLERLKSDCRRVKGIARLVLAEFFEEYICLLFLLFAQITFAIFTIFTFGIFSVANITHSPFLYITILTLL